MASGPFKGSVNQIFGGAAPAKQSKPAMPATPVAPSPENYLGEGLSLLFDGKNIVMRMPQGIYVMTPIILHAFEAFVACIRQQRGGGGKEINVEHEGKTYRAVLGRLATLDEIYRELK